MGSVGVVVAVVPRPCRSSLAPPSLIPCPVPRRRLLELTLRAVARSSGGRLLGVVGVIIFVVIWPELVVVGAREWVHTSLSSHYMGLMAPP
jgi:hypothetical protein